MSKTITPELIKQATGQFDLSVIQQLELGGIGIRSISGLAPCTSLRHLDLNTNSIQNFGELDSVPSLRSLDVSHNAIASLRDLPPLENLEELDLRGNKISSIDDLKYFSRLPSLRRLLFQNADGSDANPLCSHPGYFTEVLRLLPSLNSLDGESMVLKSAMVEAKLEEIAKEVPHVELPPSEPWFDSADLRIPKAAAGPLEGTSELLDSVSECDKLLERAKDALR